MGESLRIVGFGRPPEGAICYRRFTDCCANPPTRLLVFANDTGLTVCDWHYDLGHHQSYNVEVASILHYFEADVSEPKQVTGGAEPLTMYKLRCPECGLLVEYDGSVIWSEAEYDELPGEFICGSPECHTLIVKPPPRVSP